MPPKGWTPAGFQPTAPAAAKGRENFTVHEMASLLDYLEALSKKK